MSITERLANLSIPTVIITIVVLLALRYILLKQRTPVAKSVAEIAESLAVAMGLVFLLIRPFVVQAFFIPSESMLPTLKIHDHILVNKFIYRFREPKLADVVVFKSPPAANQDGQERDFIKRVIAVPGDIVRITPGYVTIGGAQYNHKDLESMLRGYGPPGGEGHIKLTNGRVLVDGRLVSDSEIAAAADEPNAKVKVVPGVVYLNGKPLKESYTAEDPDTPYPLPRTNQKWIVIAKDQEQSVKIPPGKLLVMGDNRNDSNDARFWGLLDRKRVLGKAMFIFWPPNRIRWVH